MIDTRAGFWLLFVIVATTLAAAILRMALGDESERTLQEAFSVAQLPCSVLLPVLAILCVTSEWSQRTALTTFALVTKRSRVVLAQGARRGGDLRDRGAARAAVRRRRDDHRLGRLRHRHVVAVR